MSRSIRSSNFCHFFAFCKDIGSRNKVIIRINGLIIGMQNQSKKRFKPRRSLTSTYLLLSPSSSSFLQKVRATRQGVQHRRICSAGSCHCQAWSDDVLGRERGAYNKVLLTMIIFSDGVLGCKTLLPLSSSNLSERNICAGNTGTTRRTRSTSMSLE